MAIMAALIYAEDPETHDRGLLLYVHPEVVDGSTAVALLESLQRHLYAERIHVGLLITPVQTFVVRDALTALKYEDNRFVQEPSLETKALFGQARVGEPLAGPPFTDQVLRWAERVGSNWFEFVPPEAVEAMVPHVIGHLAQARLARVEA